MAAIITLTTDFGLADGFAGIMKGVILGLAPGTTVVDLSHLVPPQDIRQAGLVLAAAFRYFPAGTVHVAVVDPGVGSDRRVVAVAAAGQTFLAPDNGLLSPVLRQAPADQAVALDRPELYLSSLSRTFHGRDLLAPVAARLASGWPLAAVGSPVSPDSLVQLAWPEPRLDLLAGEAAGEIIAIDHFGNCATNLTPAHGQALLAGHEGATLEAVCRGRSLGSPQTCYAAVTEGAPLVLVNSRNLLEIAVRNGHAAGALGLAIGTPVELRRRPLPQPGR
ncbi:MAG: SAM-dependent chlorinase/fluorinase [Thermodesulfobacteriota bacterium]